MGTINAGFALAAALSFTDLGLQRFWGRYRRMGGRRSRYELAEYVSGVTEWDASEHDTAARALNAYCEQVHMNIHAPLSQEV